MKGFYDIARHLVWLTQFGLSVVMPPVLFLLGALWLKTQFALGSWIVIVGFCFGLLGAVGGLRSALRSVERQGRIPKEKSSPPISFNNH